MIINSMIFPPEKKYSFFKMAAREEEGLPARCISLLEEV